MSHLSPEQLEVPAQPGSPAAEHLAGCAPCRQAVADAAGRRALVSGLVPYTLSDMAFRRVEARLMEQVEHGGLRAPSNLARWWWVLPLASVAAAAAWFLVDLGGGAAIVPLARHSPLALAPARQAPLTVLSASVDARRRHDTQPWQPLEAGDVVAAGDAVLGTSVRLAAAGEAGWVFEVSGAAALEPGTTLSLGAGALSARVPGSGVDVVAGPLHVLPTDAVFSLNRAAAEVAVDVVSGQVELVDAQASTRRTLTGPTRLRWAVGTSLASAPRSPVEPVVAPSAPRQPWVRLDVSGLPVGTVVSLDGEQVPTLPQLVSAGRHRLGVAAPGQAVHESWVELTQGYSVKLPAADVAAPEPGAGALARVRDELRRHTPKLSACYEKWLKANPGAADTTVELHLTLAPQGQVKAAEVRGGEQLSASSRDCLVRTAKGLTLPALGAEVELALPLRLTTHP